MEPAESIPGTATDRETLCEKARHSIREWARRVQVGANPNMIMAGLVTAALMPTVGPLVVGVAAGELTASLIGTSALGLVKTLLGKPGESVIGEFVKKFVASCGPLKNEDASARLVEVNQRLQTQVADQVMNGREAAAFRAEVQALITSVSGVGVALEAASEDTKAHLLQAFTQLSEQFEEFRNLSVQTLETVQEINDIVRRQSIMIQDIYDRVIGLVPVPGLQLPDADQPQVDVPCPYRGLQPYRMEDSALFFGREALTRSLATHLGRHSFVVVLGASGSGKSSLVRAGLVPRIGPAKLAGAENSTVMLMVPGGDPLGALARTLTPDASRSESLALAHQLEVDPNSVRLALNGRLDGYTDSGVVLVIDQFEEVFTLCNDETRRRSFIEALVAARHASARVKVLLVVRDDFFGRFAAYPELVAAMEQRQFLVGAMTRAELRAAVENPARAVGVSVEPELVELVVEEVLDQPGALPLLSLALAETWEKQQGARLSVSGYLRAGGVRGAVEKKADEAFVRLDADEQRLARQVLLRLIQVGEGSEATRARVRRDELTPDPASTPKVDAVIDVFVEARLLMTTGELVEITHEALIREWPTLRRWVDDNREGIRIHRQLAEGARTWVELERDPNAVLRGRRLAAANEWAEEHADELNAVEREFLEASGRMEASELQAARRRARRLATLSAALAVVVVVAAVSAGAARREASRADAQSRVALSRQLAALAELNLAGRPDVGLTRGLEAVQTAPTVEARGALLKSLQHEPRLTAFLPGLSSVWAVGFSPDGSRFAAANGLGVLLWDVERRQPIGALFDRRPWTSLAFSPDGQSLATGGETGVALWDLVSRERRADLPAGAVKAVAFSPDGQTLATGGDAGLGLWDVARGERRRELPAGAVKAVAFSPDGQTLATGGDAGLGLWDVARGERRRELLADGVATLAFSPDGRTLASGGFRGISLWAAEPGERLGVLQIESVTNVAFSPDGQTLASSTADRTVVLWDVQRGQRQGEPLVAHSGQVTSIAFAPDGQTLASGSLDATVVIWNPGRRDRLSALMADPQRVGSIDRIAVLPDGHTAASVGGEVTLWDLTVPGPKAMAPVPLEGATMKEVSGDGRRVASIDGQGMVTTWSLEDGRLMGPPFAAPGPVASLALNVEGNRLAVGSMDGTVTVWDVEAGRRVGSPLLAHTVPVVGLAFNTDGRRLASGTISEIVLWDVRRTAAIGRPLAGDGSVLALSPDGRLLASGGVDRSVTLWNLRDRTQSALGSHQAPIASLAFSPDGRLLASGGFDRSVILWDPKERQQLGTPFQGHEDPVVGLAFTPDSRVLLSASRGGGILRHDVDIRKWRETACSTFVDVTGVENLTPQPQYPAPCRLRVD
jgi:WD40 repeat protein/energy-coupling factor transporter ATP-binding protein EcfA2